MFTYRTLFLFSTFKYIDVFDNYPDSLMLTCDWLGHQTYKEWLHGKEPFEYDTTKMLFILYRNCSDKPLYNYKTKCA